MSASLVRQFETESLIAARPSQTVPLIHASPLACTSARTRPGRLVVGEPEQHLVQHDLVQHLAPGKRRHPVGEPPRMRTGSLDEVGDPRAPELADRRPHGYRPCAARELGAVSHRVADRVLLGHVEVRRRVLHRRLVVVRVRAERDPAVVGHVEPLVRVGRPRIRPLVAGDEVRERGGGCGPQAERAVDVDPCVRAVRDLDDPRRGRRRRRCSPRPPARRRWSASRPRARRRARRRPCAPRSP